MQLYAGSDGAERHLCPQVTTDLNTRDLYAGWVYQQDSVTVTLTGAEAVQTNTLRLIQMQP